MNKKQINYHSRRSIRLNFTYNLIDGALFTFALSLVSMITVFPVLVKKFGGSNVAVGLIPVIWTIGFNFPQIFVANYVSRLPYKKSFMLKTALIQRIPWLLLAVIVFFLLTEVNRTIGLILLFSGLAISAVGGSVNVPVWFDLIAKITPLNLRGRLFAFRTILGALLGVIGGIIVSYVLDNIRFPDNFSLLFLFAFLVMMVSYIFLCLLKEDNSNQADERFNNREYLKKLVIIIRNEPDFRNFLIANALLISALMADAFYTINALEKFSLSEGYAGQFTMVMMISMVVGNLIFGQLADRIGHKLNLTLAGILVFGICMLAILARSVQVYYLVFVGVALTISLIHVSKFAIVAELCKENNRAIYVALTNMITSPFILLGIMGGLVAEKFGYDLVFSIAGIFALGSALWWLIKVPEPRKKTVRG